MKKLGLIFLFVCLSDVYAVIWTQIGYADGVKFLIDKSSISRSKGATKAWFVYNYDTPHQGLAEPVHLSEMRSIHFKCSERMMLINQFGYYSQHNGTGNYLPTLNRPSDKFVDIRPNSFEEIGFMFLCGKQ